ncbi:hypothetical protein [Nocardia paucivorans]|uniref:hypothetical protein n=1 Tax=Nocardia paucivorans TaxID=114259 RepID=UPI00030F82B1|nr:hypothetical protein [Nocardia paucivorans]
MITKFVAGAVLAVGLVSMAPGIAAAGPCQPGVSKNCTDTPPPPKCQPGVSKTCPHR